MHPFARFCIFMVLLKPISPVNEGLTKNVYHNYFTGNNMFAVSADSFCFSVANYGEISLHLGNSVGYDKFYLAFGGFLP